MKFKNIKENYLTREKLVDVDRHIEFKEKLNLNKIKPNPELYKEEIIYKNWYTKKIRQNS